MLDLRNNLNELTFFSSFPFLHLYFARAPCHTHTNIVLQSNIKKKDRKKAFHLFSFPLTVAARLVCAIKLIVAFLINLSTKIFIHINCCSNIFTFCFGCALFPHRFCLCYFCSIIVLYFFLQLASILMRNYFPKAVRQRWNKFFFFLVVYFVTDDRLWFLQHLHVGKQCEASIFVF